MHVMDDMASGRPLGIHCNHKNVNIHAAYVGSVHARSLMRADHVQSCTRPPDGFCNVSLAAQSPARVHPDMWRLCSNSPKPEL